jgi:hypothetical protein
MPHDLDDVAAPEPDDELSQIVDSIHPSHTPRVDALAQLVRAAHGEAQAALDDLDAADAQREVTIAAQREHLAQLRQALLDGDDSRTIDEPDRFVLIDETGVQWALRDHARAGRELDEIERQASEAIAEINAWSDDRAFAPRRRLAARVEQLRRYAQAMRATGTKSLTTPWGKLTTRSGQHQLDVDAPVFVSCQLASRDAEAVVLDALDPGGSFGAVEVWQALQQACPLLRFDVKPNVSELRKRGRIVDHTDGTCSIVDDDGELIPGVTVTPPDIGVTVTSADPAPFVDNPVRGVDIIDAWADEVPT